MEPKGREKQSIKQEKQNKKKEIAKKTTAGSSYVETLTACNFFCVGKSYFSKRSPAQTFPLPRVSAHR